MLSYRLASRIKPNRLLEHISETEATPISLDITMAPALMSTWSLYEWREVSQSNTLSSI